MIQLFPRYNCELVQHLILLLLLFGSLAACNNKSIHVPPEDILCRDPGMEQGEATAGKTQVQAEKKLESVAVKLR
ncbi:MAG: hypothetical protein OEV64_00485 [Desulfobulbaceae bacterium]|nr:hypothetical protein [Desulfobulbaceae bacterium]